MQKPCRPKRAVQVHTGGLYDGVDLLELPARQLHQASPPPPGSTDDEGAQDGVENEGVTQLGNGLLLLQAEYAACVRRAALHVIGLRVACRKEVLHTLSAC